MDLTEDEAAISAQIEQALSGPVRLWRGPAPLLSDLGEVSGRRYEIFIPPAGVEVDGEQGQTLCEQLGHSQQVAREPLLERDLAGNLSLADEPTCPECAAEEKKNLSFEAWKGLVVRAAADLNDPK